MNLEYFLISITIGSITLPFWMFLMRRHEQKVDEHNHEIYETTLKSLPEYKVCVIKDKIMVRRSLKRRLKKNYFTLYKTIPNVSIVQYEQVYKDEEKKLAFMHFSTYFKCMAIEHDGEY